jgi:hypothetical protein
MRYFVYALLLATMMGAEVQADIGNREFRCVPVEVYELTFEGLRMATEEVQEMRTVGREFVFEEATGWKREVENDRALQYRVLNSENLVGSPFVARYGDLNPTFIKFLMSDMNDASQFIYFQFGSGMNVFGKCVVK